MRSLSMNNSSSQHRPQSAPRGRSNVYQSPGPGHYNVSSSSLRIQTSHPAAASSSSSASLHNQFAGANPVAFGRTVNPLETLSVNTFSVGGLGGSSSMLQSFSSRPLTPVYRSLPIYRIPNKSPYNFFANQQSSLTSSYYLPINQ